MKQNQRYFFHFICYYTAWFLSILFAKNNLFWGGPLVVSVITLVQALVLYKKTPRFILPFTIILTATGFLIDTCLIYTNQMNLLANPFAPFSSPWMIGLWVNFSIIFYDTCHNYFKHSIILAILSLFGFPLAYFAGTKLGAATLPQGYITLLYIGLTWMILLPSISYIFYKNAKKT